MWSTKIALVGKRDFSRDVSGTFSIFDVVIGVSSIGNVKKRKRSGGVLRHLAQMRSEASISRQNTLESDWDEHEFGIKEGARKRRKTR